MSRQEITKAQAIALANTKFWETMSHRERAEFQTSTPLLCMPFDVYQEAMEKTLARPVWTHEFAIKGHLEAELFGDKPAPTMEEIVDLLPADKRIILRGS